MSKGLLVFLNLL
jgi:hypothetical protein